MNECTIPPFPPDYRASGLLMHITSLPSPHGIGDLGPAALRWVNRLSDAGQQWWQALPVGPTGYGNSPYQPLSSFAGNDLLISPDGLVADGLLWATECATRFSPDVVDYEAVSRYKQHLILLAWKRFTSGERRDLLPEYEQFCEREKSWLEDYALFHALKMKYRGAHYLEWPANIVKRHADALTKAHYELADEIDQVRFAQFVLYRQAERLKNYAHSERVSLIGDLPFFVSPDSCDVWANPEFFLLDEHRRPRFVAGVPPDYFSAEGQLWGNPVYNWDALRATGYRWWIDRLRALLTHVDVIRLDHFRGFAAAWHVRAGSATAQSGQWVAGPGADLFHTVKGELGSLPVFAEDLGLITPDVQELRDSFRIPGTKVLQFAFDGFLQNPYLPHNFISNAVVYTSTHDNATTREWYEELPEPQRQNLWRYSKRGPGDSAEAAPALMRLSWSSVAALAVTPVQDVLNLGKEARMNVPGRPDGNWRWRCSEDLLSPRALYQLETLTVASDRSPRMELVKKAV